MSKSIDPNVELNFLNQNIKSDILSKADDLIENISNEEDFTNEIVTFGCRLNAYESQIIRDNLKIANLNNVVVFNTCAVTKEAENDALKAIKNHKKKFPDKKIIVTGCLAQTDSKNLSKMQEIDLILGNQAKLDPKNYNLDHLLQNTESQKDENDGNSEKIVKNDAKIITSNIFKEKEVGVGLVTNLEGKTRGFIQIQNGCDHFCSYCIIPYGRGKNRAVPMAQIIEQIKILLNNGYKEIIFTGVDITDYGKNIPNNPSLANLIKKVLYEVPNLERLRLSSVDVAEIDQELFELCAFEPRLMPHFHISLQSGDDVILQRMKRRHNRSQVIKFCNKLKNLRPEVSFGADIIVGFPTEDEIMFENTCKLVEEANLNFLHVFPYSIRHQTPAAKMEQIPENIKKTRAKTLRKIGEIAKNDFYKSMNGKIAKILVESNNRGKTENFCQVYLDSQTLPTENAVNNTIQTFHNALQTFDNAKNNQEGRIIEAKLNYINNKLIANI